MGSSLWGKRIVRGAVATTMVAVGAVILLQQPGTTKVRSANVLSTSAMKRQGLHWNADRCGDAYELAGRPGKCTHGGDSRIQLVETAGSGNIVATPEVWPCVGTGVDGKRVQALYIYKQGLPNRLTTLQPQFDSIAKKVEGVFAASGRETGAPRYVRFATNGGAANCGLSVKAVAVANPDEDFGTMIDQLTQLGYNNANRHYLLWVETTTPPPYCGISQEFNDDTPGASNLNEDYPLMARIDCWDFAEPHEIMHTLGSVMDSAPNSTGMSHCNDLHDVMCYADGGPKSNLQTKCPTRSEWIYDCNNDDYFNTNPSGSNYLTTHWNTANSAFLTTTNGQAAPVAASATPNLFSNPGFEAGISPWAPGSSAISGVALNDGTSRSGVRYARFSSTAPGQTMTRTVTKSAKAGESYTFSAMARSTSPGYTVGILQLSNAAGTQLTNSILLLGPDWTPVSVPLNLTSDTTGLKATIGVWDANKSLDFDDTALTQSLLQSASFEAGQANWMASGTPVTLRLFSNAWEGRDGPGYLQMTTSVAGGNVNQSYVKPLAVGQTYRMTAWVKSASSTSVNGSLRLDNVGNGTDSAQTSFSATSSWTQVSVPVSITRAGTSLKASISVSTLNKSLNIDGVVLVRDR